MTLAQLKAFVLVARLGSVKAAAAALGVSEPAVSQALAALRLHLGDPLLSRGGGQAGRGGSAMELTDAGRRVVGIASQMVNLSNDAEAAVRQSQGAPELLRVVATPTIAEAVAPSLLQAFSGRTTNVDVTLATAATVEMAALLQERLADVALGPDLAALDPVAFDSAALFRYQLVFLVAKTSALLHEAMNESNLTAPMQPSMLRSQTWFVDPHGVDLHSEVNQMLTTLGVPPEDVRVFPSPSAALAAAAQGGGVAPAVAYLAQPAIDAGTLVRLPIADTPIAMLWHVSSLTGNNRQTIAGKFRRFLATPDAMHAMRRVDGSVPSNRFRPPVHITIWS
jgi:LysR family transcriptional regulator, low CO2-responsive transcriptional regulator